MRLRNAISLFTLVGFLLFSGLVLAQSPTTGEIVGQVLDQQGSVVAGAKVTLTSSSGAVREVKSDANGRYRFPLIDPGAYTLQVEASGFKSASVSAVQVRITETTPANVRLTVAGSTETVTVNDQPAVVEENATTGRVIGKPRSTSFRCPRGTTPSCSPCRLAPSAACLTTPSWDAVTPTST